MVEKHILTKKCLQQKTKIHTNCKFALTQVQLLPLPQETKSNMLKLKINKQKEIDMKNIMFKSKRKSKR